MGSTSTSKTIDILQHLFSRYGIPEQIVSDNGPQFRSEEFEGFTRSLGMRHYRSAVYHPATNGAVEHFVKTLNSLLRLGSWWVPPLKKYFVTSYFSIGLHPIRLLKFHQVSSSWDDHFELC